MRDPLWGTTWRISAGAMGLAAAISAVLLSLGHSRDALGLMCGALISGVNFLATGRFLSHARLAAGRSGSLAAGGNGGAGAVKQVDPVFAKSHCGGSIPWLEVAIPCIADLGYTAFKTGKILLIGYFY